jgi:hypothetical protein
MMSLALALKLQGKWEISWSQEDILGDDAADSFKMRKIYNKKGV